MHYNLYVYIDFHPHDVGKIIEASTLDRYIDKIIDPFFDSCEGAVPPFALTYDWYKIDRSKSHYISTQELNYDDFNPLAAYIDNVLWINAERYPYFHPGNENKIKEDKIRQYGDIKQIMTKSAEKIKNILKEKNGYLVIVDCHS